MRERFVVSKNAIDAGKLAVDSRISLTQGIVIVNNSPAMNLFRRKWASRLADGPQISLFDYAERD